MKLKIKQVGPGLHPNEVVISIQTKEGTEQLAVNQRVLQEGLLKLDGFPVGSQDEFLLVELPQETFRGFWRVWVPKSEISEAQAA